MNERNGSIDDENSYNDTRRFSGFFLFSFYLCIFVPSIHFNERIKIKIKIVCSLVFSIEHCVVEIIVSGTEFSSVFLPYSSTLLLSGTQRSVRNRTKLKICTNYTQSVSKFFYSRHSFAGNGLEQARLFLLLLLLLLIIIILTVIILNHYYYYYKKIIIVIIIKTITIIFIIGE